jgi:hypothetical protein
VTSNIQNLVNKFNHIEIEKSGNLNSVNQFGKIDIDIEIETETEIEIGRERERDREREREREGGGEGASERGEERKADTNKEGA